MMYILSEETTEIPVNSTDDDDDLYLLLSCCCCTFFLWLPVCQRMSDDIFTFGGV